MNNTTHPGMIGTVKDKSVGAIKGTGNIAEAAVDTTAHVITTTVKDTAEIGGGVEAAATGLVTGAIKGVKKIGVGAEKAVAAVAGGAIKAVGAVGSTAVHTVHNVVTQPLHGDKVAPKDPAMAASKK